MKTECQTAFIDSPPRDWKFISHPSLYRCPHGNKPQSTKPLHLDVREWRSHSKFEVSSVQFEVPVDKAGTKALKPEH